VHNLCSGLGVRQAQGRAVEIDVGPLQGHDLVQAAASQDQKACGKDCRGQFYAFRLHLAQHLANPTQFSRAQEPFAFLLGVFPDVLARVGPVRTQAPHLGQAEHLRDHLEAAVGLIGDVAQVMVELGDIRPRDPCHRQLSDGGQDEALQVPAILFAGAGLHANGDVFPVKPLRHFLDRDGLSPGVPLGGRIRAVARRSDDGDGPSARLLAGQHRVWPEANPPRPASGAVLDHIAFAATREHAKAEAGNVAVPDKVFSGLDVCGVDDALGELGHGNSAFQVCWLPLCATRRPSQRTH
jgi:hypothetical protein